MNKKEALRKIALTTLNNHLYQKEINSIMQRFNISKEEIIENYINYDMDILSYGNEIFDSLLIRVVIHLHNLLEGSWHIKRQNIVHQLIEEINPNHLIEIGFGTPQKYVKELLKKKTSKITLMDLADNSIIFAKYLLSIWDQNWSEMINFKQGDMAEIEKFVGDFDLYIFQDSIEHSLDPTACLKEYVRRSQENAKFIFSLPIGPMIPQHYIAWETEEEILSWLQGAGLKIHKNSLISMNPAVDLFADNYPLVACIASCYK